MIQQDDLSGLSDEELARIAGVTLQAPARQQAAPRPQTAPSSAPRGIRNNNPGNIEDGAFARSLPGYAGSDGRFARFDSPDAGGQAKAQLLGSYVRRGFDTPSEIINRWAPPSDNNPTQAYASYVAQRVGIGPNDRVTEDQIPLIAQAIAEFENGGQQSGAPAPAPQDDLDGLSDEELMQIANETGQPQQAAPGGSQNDPIDLTGKLYQDQVDALKQGAWVRAQNGEVYQLPGDAFTASARSSDEAQSGNVFVRRPNLEDRIGAFASAASEQIPFSDELSALTVGTLSGDGYLATRESQMNSRDLLNQTNRGDRVAGGLAGFASTIALPGVASSGRYVAQGANRAEQARRAMQVGGAGGALYGAANTDGGLEERGTGALLGGGIGAAAGPVGNEIARGLPGLFRRTGSGFAEAGARVQRGVGIQPKDAPITEEATQSALAYVRDLAARSGRDLATDSTAALGKPITAAEAMGPMGVSQVAALSRRSGRAGDMAQDVLGSRAIEQSARIVDDLSSTSGLQAGAAQDAVASLAAQSRQQAAPLYDQAYQVQNVTSPTLQTLLNRPSMRSAMSKAASIAREEGRNPEDLGFVVDRIRRPGGGWTEEVSEVSTPSMQTWDYVKRGLDDVLEAYRDPTSRKMNLDTAGRAAEQTRQALRSELTNPQTPWGPAYRAALDAGGDAPRLEGAFREGPNLFSSTVNERTFRNRVTMMSEADRNATLSGVVDDLYNKARTGRINIRQLRTPAAREKLVLLMGPEGADSFVTRLAAEADMARSGGRMAPGTNSITSEVQAAMQEQDRGVGIANDFANNLEESAGPVSALMKTVTSAAMSPLAGFVRGAQSPASQPVRDEIARLLLLSPDDLSKLLGTQLQRPSRPSRGAAGAGLFGGSAASNYATSSR